MVSDKLESFDPNDHIILFRGKPYLECKWRLFWMRLEHPDWSVETEMIRIEDRAVEKVKDARQVPFAMFKATILDNLGHVIASSHGSETALDWGDYVEKAECVPVSSQILTREGWKYHDELVLGEDVLAYDVEQDKNVWTPLQLVTVHDNRNVVRMTNNAGFSIECTPNHSWAVIHHTSEKMKPTKKRILREANKLRKNDNLILAAKSPSGDSPITPNEAATLGWIFTDGTTYYNKNGSPSRSVIQQSKQENVSGIRELVGSVGIKEYVTKTRTRTFPTGRTYDTLPQHQFFISAENTQKLFQKAEITGKSDLPALVLRLSQEARASMLDTMMKAEADKRYNFAQNPGPVLAAFQILATLEGKALGNLCKTSFGNCLTQRLKKRRSLSCSQLSFENMGKKQVWCPTTAYGTWVMKQNDRILITGNTKAIARALAAAGYGTIQSLEFDFDEGRDEKGEINLSDSPGPEVKPKTIDTSKQFGTPVKTTQPQVSSNHYKCSECGGEITGYKSTSGTVYSADDVVASTSKATGFPLCKQCYLKKTKPVDNKPTP